MAGRWWIYQRERFPLLQFGAFLAAVCFGVLAFSTLRRGGDLRVESFAVAFACAMLFFFQLRVADEFKDFEDDLAARPYRPVQRGLVKLWELRVAAVAAMVVQVVLVVWLSPHLLLPLAAVLVYLGLMTREFFAGNWLRARPLLYLASHQVILPLIYLFISACDWLVAGAPIPPGLGWILAMGYCSGVVVEIGRKLRAPDDEETGVETYSALWGWKRALAVWIGVAVADAAAATVAGSVLGIGRWVAVVSAALLLAVALTAARFARSPAAGAGGTIEAMAGVWTVLLHASLGIGLIA